MIIRSITPADQEQLLLLEEELHDNEGKKHNATLEEALEFIADDELVEIVPDDIRLRKKLLKEIERRRAGR